jgi:hypothetical protein
MNADFVEDKLRKEWESHGRPNIRKDALNIIQEGLDKYTEASKM